ncbi:MAG: hypothetical protein ABIF85_07745 [Nanoarchaeota archaeon]|nr:hypothetical protein [Nanoarchaeota archaeon]MCG2724267.1 hypothetical protein [archaeon]
MLYLKDAYLSEVWVNVLAIEGKKVLTEKTIFSPKTHEQIGDIGLFDGIPLLGVLKQGEEIWHMLDRKPRLNIGEQALLKLNWKKRYQTLRLHTALHMLAQIFKREFKKYADILTIDETGAHLEFNEEIDVMTINKVLMLANEMILKGSELEPFIDELTGKKAINIGYLPKFECDGLFVKDIKEIGAISFSGEDFKSGKFIITINVESVK